MKDAYGNDTISGVLRTGFKVWLREIGLMFKTLIRRYEIGRLEKRLEEEYGLLGRIAESPRGKMDDKELCLRQIKFLKEEIAQLEADLDKVRQ